MGSSKKDEPKAPRAPDPRVTADAQAQANQQAIYDSARVNRYDQYNPYGSVTWDRPSDDPSTWTQRVNLDPAIQQRFDNESQLALGIGSAANRQVGNLPQGQFTTQDLPELQAGLNQGALPTLSTDFSGDATRMEDATYQRALGLMNPEFDRQQKQLENRLVQQGIPIGAEAYNDEMGRFEKGRNEAQLAAALEAVGAGRQEHSRMFGVNQRARQQGVAEQGQDFSMTQAARQQGVSDRQLERNQAYNELAMLMGQTPAMPSMNAPQTAQYQIAPPDRMGAEQLAYQGQLNNYNQKMQSNAAKKGGTTDLASTAMMAAMMASDIALKDNVEFVGEARGHRLYRWTWNDKARELGHVGEGFGVIAQEVEGYAPHLVHERNGYKAVDYSGILGGRNVH
jgi:hypothetical protein